MNQSLDKMKAELLKNIETLPEETQQAFAWLINNYEYALNMCKAKKLSTEERSQLENIVQKRNDPLLRLLMIMERIVNENETNCEQP